MPQKKENYRPVSLSLVPDCCGVCWVGDADGEGCEVLTNMGFGHGEKQLNAEFNYFYVCDKFERISWEPIGR